MDALFTVAASLIIFALVFFARFIQRRFWVAVVAGANQRQTAWTEHEEGLFSRAASEFPPNGPDRWAKISQRVGRPAKDCRAKAHLLQRAAQVALAQAPLPAMPSPVAPPLQRLDLSSAAALLASLRELVPGHLKTGADVTVHMPLLVVDLLSGETLRDAFAACAHHEDAVRVVETMERRGSVRGIAAALAKRAAAAGHRGVHAKEHDAIVAQQSAPGGGKTAALEVLAQLSSTSLWGPALCPDDAMRAVLNASIPITVTFNAEMPADLSSYDADPQTGLALRVLYSGLVRSSLSFGKFWREYFPHGSTLDVRTVIECCQIAFGQLAPDRRGILLLVDEAAKLARTSGPHNAELMLTALGALLDCYISSELNVVCSTLDALLLNRCRTASGRAIIYVSLPELTQSAAEVMFAKALTRILRRTPLPSSMRIAISDCAGHLRTLEHLLRAAEVASPVFALDDLRDRTVAALAHHTDDTPAWAISAALRGDAMALTEAVAGSNGVTFCDAITSGTFINTSAFGSSAVVPKLSMMYLLRFAFAQDDSSPLRSSIRGMAAAEEGACMPNVPSLGGEPFEIFVSHFLRLTTVLESESSRSLAQFLHVSLDEIANPDIPSRVREQLCRPYSCDIPGHIFAQLHTLTFGAAARDDRCHALEAAGIFSFRINNPAFDLLYLSGPSRDKDRYAVAFEARITTPGSSRRAGERRARIADHTDSLTEVERKVALAHMHCRQGEAFDEIGVNVANVLYVYLAARTITGFGIASRAAYLARGVVILDRPAAEIFLTPTLRGCLMFRECV